MSGVKFRKCKVTDCNGNSHYTAHGARGWCSSHNNRWDKHGDPLAGGTCRGEPLKWLQNVAMKYEGDECLFWPYGRGKDGYARVRFKGKTCPGHRVVCAGTYGAPPSDAHVAAHSCGQGHLGCVNPKHVRWATQKENQNDRLAHGTDNRGEKHPMSKLKEADVIGIKQRLSKGEPQRLLAAEFGVGQSAISLIASGRSWGWLAEPNVGGVT